MNPMLTQLLPSSAAWLRAAFPVARAEKPARVLPDIVLDETMLYRSECFAEDLQVASDAALADLFPMLRVKRAAVAGR
jgi:hypothetical protein